jgi:hypothetical protein
MNIVPNTKGTVQFTPLKFCCNFALLSTLYQHQRASVFVLTTAIVTLVKGDILQDDDIVT